MQLAQFAKSYKSVAVTTATPGQLVLMLFDGALRFMAAAQRGSAQEDIAVKNEAIHNNLVKAQNILRELQCSLNMEAGGEFSQRMYALYDFMTSLLHEANLKKDLEPVRTVERMLGEIRDAWAQMLDRSVTQIA